MERSFERCSLEGIKTTMLKQEEIFNQQVRELHRLYSVQRVLMDHQMKNEINQQSKNLTTPTIVSQSRVGQGYNFHVQNEVVHHRGEQSGSRSGTGYDFNILHPADYHDENSTGMSIAAIEAASGPSSSCSIIMQGTSLVGLEKDVWGMDLTLGMGGCGGGSNKRTKVSQPHRCIGLGCSESTESDQRNQDQHQYRSLSTTRRSNKRSNNNT